MRGVCNVCCCGCCCLLRRTPFLLVMILFFVFLFSNFCFLFYTAVVGSGTHISNITTSPFSADAYWSLTTGMLKFYITLILLLLFIILFYFCYFFTLFITLIKSQTKHQNFICMKKTCKYYPNKKNGFICVLLGIEKIFACFCVENREKTLKSVRPIDRMHKLYFI